MSAALSVQSPAPATLPRFLRQRRQELGLSLRDVAEQTGLGRQTIFNCESAPANPTVHTLRRLGRGLGVPAAALAALALGSDDGDQRDL
jgi:transcriptional regulator with XRE-family HTH domain